MSTSLWGRNLVETKSIWHRTESIVRLRSSPDADIRQSPRTTPASDSLAISRNDDYFLIFPLKITCKMLQKHNKIKKFTPRTQRRHMFHRYPKSRNTRTKALHKFAPNNVHNCLCSLVRHLTHMEQSTAAKFLCGFRRLPNTRSTRKVKAKTAATRPSISGTRSVEILKRI